MTRTADTHCSGRGSLLRHIRIHFRLAANFPSPLQPAFCQSVSQVGGGARPLTPSHPPQEPENVSGSLASWISRIWGLGRPGCVFCAAFEWDFLSQLFRAALIMINSSAPRHWLLQLPARGPFFTFRPQLTRVGFWPAARVAVAILELPAAALYLLLCLRRL